MSRTETRPVHQPSPSRQIVPLPALLVVLIVCAFLFLLHWVPQTKEVFTAPDHSSLQLIPAQKAMGFVILWSGVLAELSQVLVLISASALLVRKSSTVVKMLRISLLLSVPLICVFMLILGWALPITCCVFVLGAELSQLQTIGTAILVFGYFFCSLAVLRRLQHLPVPG